MAMRAKSTGTTAADNVGVFDSRLKKGQATGLVRGTAPITTQKVGVVGKTKYKLNSRGETTYN